MDTSVESSYIVCFAGRGAEKLLRCADCWPARHLVSVDVSENRAHHCDGSLWPQLVLGMPRLEVMRPMKRSSLCRADSWGVAAQLSYSRQLKQLCRGAFLAVCKFTPSDSPTTGSADDHSEAPRSPMGKIHAQSWLQHSRSWSASLCGWPANCQAVCLALLES